MMGFLIGYVKIDLNIIATDVGTCFVEKTSFLEAF